MDDDTAGWLFLIGLLVAIILIIVAVYNSGHDAGAKAHANGQVVVTTLPDGSQVVTKVKKEEQK